MTEYLSPHSEIKLTIQNDKLSQIIRERVERMMETSFSEGWKQPADYKYNMTINVTGAWCKEFESRILTVNSPYQRATDTFTLVCDYIIVDIYNATQKDDVSDIRP